MTNGAAIGYALLAGMAMGLSKQQLQILEGEMRTCMDEHTEEEAEEVYINN